MNKKRVILLSLLSLCGVGYWMVWYFVFLQHCLIVENQSGQILESVEIKIGRETISFGKLSAGEVAHASFHIAADDHFIVKGLLANGTRIHQECGYVNIGHIALRAFFTIQPDGTIAFKQYDADP